MRIEQLLYITEISKSGSIAITSDRLHISPQGISQAIKSLEEELGVKIFERSRTGLVPSLEGENLIKSAQKILNKIEAFKEEAHSYSSQIAGNLSIIAAYALCKSIIPQTVAVFKTKFPKINLEIKEREGPSQIQKSILKGDADIGLSILTPSLLEENKLLITTHILDSPLMVYFKNTSELARKKIITSKDVLKYPIIANVSDNESEKYRETLRKYGKPNFLFYSNSSEIKKCIVLQGLGVAFENALSLRLDPHIQRGDLLAAPIKEIEEKVSFYSIQLKNQRLSTAGKEFMKELYIQAEPFKN